MKNPLHTTLLRGALLAATLTGAAAAQGTATFCDPGQPNSTGSAAVLAGTFTGSALHLEATSGPNNQFGYVVVSGSTSAGIPISQGLLCLGSPIGRYNAAAGATKNSLGRFEAGVFVNLSGTSTSGTGFDVPADLPGPINGTITPGQTWNFQLWYRDIGANSNFTNGLAATYPSGAVSFADVYAAFEQIDPSVGLSCIDCHAVGGFGGLNMANQTTAYNNLVGVTANCGSGNTRVVSGDSAASLLYTKLAGTQTCGSSMPFGAIWSGDLALVFDWIEGGAQP